MWRRHRSAAQLRDAYLVPPWAARLPGQQIWEETPGEAGYLEHQFAISYPPREAVSYPPCELVARIRGRGRCPGSAFFPLTIAGRRPS